METITMSLQLGRSLDEQNDKLYKQINKYYETINRELVNKILHRFNEIIDMYYKYTFPNISDEEREQTQKFILTKRILKNEKFPKHQLFDIVLTLVDEVFHFMDAYDNHRNRLFDNLDLIQWMHCDVFPYNMEHRWAYKFSDYYIPSTMERFFSISDAEINSILMMNNQEFNHQELRLAVNLIY